MNNKLPTCKQLERDLSQNIRAFYVKEINHPPQKITCKIFSRYIAIVSEEALTPLEISIWELGEKDFILEIRREIDKVIKPKLSKLIEEMLNIQVEDILSDVSFTKNRIASIVLLSNIPQTRKSKSISKFHKQESIQGHDLVK